MEQLARIVYRVINQQKEKLLIAIVVLLMPLEMGAQQRHRGDRQLITAYPILGATVSQIEGDELKGFKKIGFTAGVGAQVSLSESDRWHITVEAAYSQRGSYNNTLTPYGLYFFTLNYADIPLTLFYTDPRGGLTFGGGLVYSRLVRQPHGAVIYTPTSFVPDSTNLNQFNRNDIAAALDIRLPVWRGLILEIRYQYSILPIKKDWTFTEYINWNEENNSRTWSNKCYNSSITLRLIYLIGKKD